MRPETTLFAYVGVFLSILGGCAPVDDEAAVTSQALTGPGPVRPAAPPTTDPQGVSAWSLGQGANGWSDIALGDIDGDGRDDLCGYYGDSWGCARNLSGQGFDAFVEAPEALAFSRATIRVVDLNGDGRAEVCGRDSQGFACVYWNWRGARLAPEEPRRTVRYIGLRDQDGWGAPQYETTLMTGRLSAFQDGRDVCIRRSGGVLCVRFLGTQQPMRGAVNIPAFSDANGWDRPQYYHFSGRCARASA